MIRRGWALSGGVREPARNSGDIYYAEVKETASPGLTPFFLQGERKSHLDTFAVMDSGLLISTSDEDTSLSVFGNNGARISVVKMGNARPVELLAMGPNVAFIDRSTNALATVSEAALLRRDDLPLRAEQFTLTSGKPLEGVANLASWKGVVYSSTTSGLEIVSDREREPLFLPLISTGAQSQAVSISVCSSMIALGSEERTKILLVPRPSPVTVHFSATSGARNPLLFKVLTFLQSKGTLSVEDYTLNTTGISFGERCPALGFKRTSDIPIC